MYKKLLLSTLLCLIPVTKPAIHWSPKNIGIAGGAASGTLALGSFITWRLLKSAKKKLRLAEREVNKAPSNKKRQQTVAQLKKNVAFLEGQIKVLGASTVGMLLLTGGAAAGQYWRTNRKVATADPIKTSLQAPNAHTPPAAIPEPRHLTHITAPSRQPLESTAIIPEINETQEEHPEITQDAMLEAIKAGDATAVNTILQHIANPSDKKEFLNSLAPNKKSLLYCAMQSPAAKKIIPLLIHEGADPLKHVTRHSSEGETLIADFIRDENCSLEQTINAVSTLLAALSVDQRTILVNLAPPGRTTPLEAAMMLVSEELLRILLDAGANPCQISGGETLLTDFLDNNRSSTQGGHITSSIRTLFNELTQQQKEQLINLTDSEGNSPLILAAKEKENFHTMFPFVISLLLAHGADPLATDSNGNTVLTLVCKNGGDPQVVLKELTPDQKSTLINKAETMHGLTPLLCLALHSNIYDKAPSLSKRVHTLISNGADPLATDNDGHTILTLMCTFAFPTEDIKDVLKLLTTQQKAQLLNQANQKGITPLMATINGATKRNKQKASVKYRQAFATIRLLINEGANPFAADGPGNTLLAQTLCYENMMPEIYIQSLLDTVFTEDQRTQLLNQTDSRGRSLLLGLAQLRALVEREKTFDYLVPIMCLFIEKGADPLATDNNGNNLAMYLNAGDMPAKNMQSLLNMLTPSQKTTLLNQANKAGLTALSTVLVSALKTETFPYTQALTKMQLFIDNGADPFTTAEFTNGRILLKLAILSNQPDLVRLILKAFFTYARDPQQIAAVMTTQAIDALCDECSQVPVETAESAFDLAKRLGKVPYKNSAEIVEILNDALKKTAWATYKKRYSPHPESPIPSRTHDGAATAASRPTKDTP